MSLKVSSELYLSTGRWSVIKTSITVNRSEGRSKDIAIVGLSCRYPNGGSIDELWDSLNRGVDSVQPATYVNHSGGQYETMGGFIPSIDQFDSYPSTKR